MCLCRTSTWWRASFCPGQYDAVPAHLGVNLQPGTLSLYTARRPLCCVSESPHQLVSYLCSNSWRRARLLHEVVVMGGCVLVNQRELPHGNRLCGGGNRLLFPCDCFLFLANWLNGKDCLPTQISYVWVLFFFIKLKLLLMIFTGNCSRWASSPQKLLLPQTTAIIILSRQWILRV